MFKARSCAKINLYLHIKGKRDDGYHLIESEFQTVGLYDEINFSPAEKFSLECSGEVVPCDETNLIYRAYKLFISRTGINFGVKVILNKNIPPGRGLGGGSSNAAITLIVLNKIFKTNLGIDELHSFAAELGADVPFFLKGGRAKIRGIGDKIFPLKDTKGFVVIVDPGIEISTAEAYRVYDNLMEKGFDFSSFKNHLLPSAINLEPELKILYEMKMDMTGSGSCFFKIFPDRTHALAFYDKIQRWRKWVVPFVSSREYRTFTIGE